MADARAKELIDLGDRLFSKREPLIGLWQELAENFYPERADFYPRNMLGMDFADHLTDSFPVMCRRELGDAMAAMLRPKDRPWFRTTTLDEERDNIAENAQSLDYVTTLIRRQIYDPRTQFVSTTKEGDYDWTTFGQCVLSVEENRDDDCLYFQNHHLRDCAWLTNSRKVIDHLHRKDVMTARAMRGKFQQKKLHQSILRAAEKEPYKEFPLRCVVLPAQEYDYTAKGDKKPQRKLPFVIAYIDVENCQVIDEAGLSDFIYVVPRWKTISGSQYAFSPATMTALPDARMSQMLARIILEAGEKAVDPPMLAVEEAVREVNIAAGAITWADIAYDSKLKEAVQPIQIDANMQVGFAMRQDLRELLTKAFFLDRLRLPEGGPAETATEIRAMMQEHVRNLLPLFEPMEVEYNSKLLDKSLNTLRNMNKIDSARISDDLSNSDVTFSFKSPIEDAQDQELLAQFQQALQIEGAVSQVGVTTPRVDFAIARDDALRGTSMPAKWRRTDAQMTDEVKARALQEQINAAAQGVSGAANVAGQVADTSMKIGQAAQPPQQLPPPSAGNRPQLPAPRAA